MAVYAIGDIQGCFVCLQRLLDTIKFDPATDQIWLAGDLVNRGPNSLEVLRFIKGLGASVVSVLGNHDLHLIANAYGKGKLRSRDTLQPVLDAPDCDELIDWLRFRPLFHVKQSYALVHAGIAPQWTINDASKYALEVENILQSQQIDDFLKNMYGNEPKSWSQDLTGWKRLRFIANVFTRIRYCTHDGALQMKAKYSPSKKSGKLIPWFEMENRQTTKATIVFGHWSTLGLNVNQNIISLDTGCVWGGSLTAVRLDKSRQVFQVHCRKSD
ncbi:MAG: symmetrical bis(5'-nucleosyl)-tetraphosphatase [Methylococcales bacterium]